MKRIIHISDLHFGTENVAIVKALLKDINTIKPDLIVVSGDLTQRARTHQFKLAGDFIAQINFPKIIVPGNHDISLYNIIRRFFKPLNRFKKYIIDNPYPDYEDDSILAVGLNSSRSLTFQSGRVSANQIEYLQERFSRIDSDKLKILIVHHNVFPLHGEKMSAAIGRSKLLKNMIQSCGIDLILSGHLHKGYSFEFQFNQKHKTVFVQAGTATSSRLRDEKNNYNLISYDDNLVVELREFHNKVFEKSSVKVYSTK
jgi:3',5'-cyclic AMP phosphodiesterase CpdA